MNVDAFAPAAAVAAPDHPDRFDLYKSVHKGLRSALFRTVELLARSDPDRPAERLAALGLVDDVLAISTWHADAEDAHIHAALAAKGAGIVTPFDAEHDEHRREIESLAAEAEALRGAPDAAGWHDFHLRFAHFAAHSVLHMEAEERRLNPVLWHVFDDSELQAIQKAILAALGPRMLAFLRVMFPAMSQPERVRLLEGPGRHAPPPTAAAIRRTARATLDAVDLARLGALVSKHDSSGPALLVIDFPFAGPFGAQMSEAFADLADEIAATPGFKWKIWTEDADRERGGGIYLFDDRAALDAYLRQHSERLESFGVSGVRAEVFAVNAPLSRINGATWADDWP